MDRGLRKKRMINSVATLSYNNILYSQKFSPGENFFPSCVKDCIADMATFTALAKILSLDNYYNTKIAELVENFYPTNILGYTVIQGAAV